MNINGNGIPYALKEAFKNIRINGLMSTASVFVLLACLVIMGSSVLLMVNFNKFIVEIGNKNEVYIYLEDNNTQEKNAEVGTKLRAIPNISEVTYLTKEEILELAKIKLPNQKFYLENVDENPFRNAYRIKMKDLEKHEETIVMISNVEGVANTGDEVDKAVINGIIKYRDVITVLSLWIVGILLFMSLFIVSNTVRIAMFTRKLEINIMKFVGATDNFIRLPFLIEGFILGVFSGIIAALLQWFIYSQVINNLLSDISQPIPFGQMAVKVFGCFILSGMFLGTLGSILPMRKYLKV